MSSIHDPLKDVDPWDHIRKRKEYQNRSEIEKFLSGLYGPPQTIMRMDQSDPPSYYELESGQILRNVHPSEVCEGRPCVIHHPSDHPLKNGPRRWDQNMVWRLCAHYNIHPDFDSVANTIDRMGSIEVVHFCCADNCCGMPDRISIRG